MCERERKIVTVIVNPRYLLTTVTLDWTVRWHVAAACRLDVSLKVNAPRPLGSALHRVLLSASSIDVGDVLQVVTCVRW